MIRKRQEWKIRGGALALGERTLIMGILNVTPDSFSDGGEFLSPERALDHALKMQANGADIIDIGAESTHPGSQRVSEHDEIARLIPVLKKLKGKLDIPISVDTYKPAVAELAIEHGAQIVNDVSGLAWQPELAKVVRDSGAGLILNHMRGTPETWARLAPMRDVMGEIAAELEASVHRARRDGVPLENIVIDPGIGFGKRKEQNSEIIARLAELGRLLRPILLGPSRKSFLLQQDTEALDYATAASVALGIWNGALIVRVHNVEAMRPVVVTTDALIAATPEPHVEEDRPRAPRKRDFDLRPDREHTGPPRPAIKKVAAPPPAPDPKPADEPAGPPRDFKPAGDRPPRRDFKPAGDRPARPPRDFKPQGDRPPRRDFKPQGDRPPRRDFKPAGDRPARPPRDFKPGGDRPPRPPRDFKPAGDRPARPPRDFKPGGDRPSRPPRDFKPAGDRPARPPRDSKPEGDRPARPPRDFRPGRGDSKPTGSRPPTKRPGGGGPNRGGPRRGPNTPGGRRS